MVCLGLQTGKSFTSGRDIRDLIIKQDIIASGMCHRSETYGDRHRICSSINILGCTDCLVIIKIGWNQYLSPITKISP